MSLANIIADISSLNDRDKESIFDFLTRHFSVSASQQGALIGELRERKFSWFSLSTLWKYISGSLWEARRSPTL